MNFRSFYEKLNYKALMIFPIGLLIFSVIFLFYNYQATGEFFQRDIDLKGGIQLSVTLKNPINSVDLENFLKTKTSEVSVRSIISATTYGILIEAPEGSEEELLFYLEEYGLDIEESSFQKTGPGKRIGR